MPSDGKYIVDVVGGKITNGIPYEVGMTSPTLFQQALPFVLIGGAVLLMFLVLFIVKQQSIKIVERFGRFKKAAKPGLNWKIPLIDRVVGALDLRVQELSTEVTVKTSDNAFVSVPVKVQYQVNPEKAQDAFYQLSNAKQQISSYIVNIVRSTATDLSMEEVFKSKDKFESGAKDSLREQFSGFGFEIINVLVDDPRPSPEVVASFNRVIAAKQLKEAATNEGEAVRIKTVAVAQAEADSLNLKAEAYVKQRKTIADGLDAIAEKHSWLMEYLVGIDWRDTVRDAANKGAVVMVPTPFDGSNVGPLMTALKGIERSKSGPGVEFQTGISRSGTIGG